MSPWLILFVSCAYLFTGLEQLLLNKPWFGLMWICYAVANLALYKAGAV